MRRARLLFVEGHMRLDIVERLARGSISVLPRLRTLFVEPWPRDCERFEDEYVGMKGWRKEWIGEVL